MVQDYDQRQMLPVLISSDGVIREIEDVSPGWFWGADRKLNIDE